MSLSIQARLAAFVCAAAVSSAVAPVARAAAITKTDTLPLTSTNFSTDSPGLSPLTIPQFDTHGNALVLDSVDLIFHAKIQNDFGMTFTTPATITATVGAGNGKGTGPVITMYQPDGKTPLLSATPTDPKASTRTITYGNNPGEKLPQSFGTDQPVGSRFYLAPSVTQASNSLHLTAPADLKLFTGTGTVKLPVAATAFSEFVSTSGNGSGWVSTYGTADVTVKYTYHEPAPQTVPEPSAVLLWGGCGFAALAAARARRRRSA